MTSTRHKGEETSGSAGAQKDRRRRKTERQLWQALLSLMQEHDWPQITIQAICDRATFYTHYRTKQDLLDAGFAIGTQEAARSVLAGPVVPGRIATLHWLVAHLAGSKTFLRRLRASTAGLAINARFKETVRTMLAQELKRAGLALDATQLTFLTGGVFAVTDRWIEKGGRDRPEMLLQKLHVLAAAVTTARP
jgi:AcrR family transcriptional regulator